MARTESEKYTTRRYQDARGRWHTTRELVHDTRYCDLCDSEDVEQLRELLTVNGWYGGIKILWSARGGVDGPQVVAVLCRSCRRLHDEAYWNAERRPVEVDDFGLISQQLAYFCPAHNTDHCEDRMDVEWRETQRSEMKEFLD